VVVQVTVNIHRPWLHSLALVILAFQGQFKYFLLKCHHFAPIHHLDHYSILLLLTMGDLSQATLRTLANADGSATYTVPHQGFKMIAGVNYPVEVPYRSDEIPESTYIEVNLRPHNGVGMVKERHVEELIKRTLHVIVLGEQTPRTMLQVTLQVVSVDIDESLPGGVKGGGQGETYLGVLSSALNAAVLGCLDAGVQMKNVAGATLIGLSRKDGQVVINPGVLQRKKCSSLHVFAFDKDGSSLLIESEGRFDLNGLEQAEQAARLAVLGHVVDSANGSQTNKQQHGDVPMNGTDNNSGIPVMDVIRKAMDARVIKDESWRQD
jgi:exosome complex component RRP46